MNETLNLNQYLFLKQQLVILEAQYLNAVISVNDRELSVDNIGSSLKAVIDDVERNLTPPVALMELRKTNINFVALDQSVCAFLKQYFDDRQYELSSLDKLAELVNKYPKTTQVISLAEGENEMFQCTRGEIVHLLGTLNKLYEVISSWPSDRAKGVGVPLREVLICVNFIQMLDELFEYTNEKFGA